LYIQPFYFDHFDLVHLLLQLNQKHHKKAGQKGRHFMTARFKIILDFEDLPHQ
jgi:hypothetical protein